MSDQILAAPEIAGTVVAQPARPAIVVREIDPSLGLDRIAQRRVTPVAHARCAPKSQRELSSMMRRQVIHDPLYGPVHLDEVAVSIIDTAEYQRLRRIKQLSMASLMYPGAMHTRFEHAIGVHHLAKTVIQTLTARGELDEFTEMEIRTVEYAALCHDMGHAGVGSHTLEDCGYPGASHEEAGSRFFLTGPVGDILASVGGPEMGRNVAALVDGTSAHPLIGLVSGDCDPDKMDYLRRDPYHCGLGISYDQATLKSGICVLKDPATGAPSLGIDSAVLPIFEQMLYVKNLMYRNVYFHPVVLSAASMLRSLVIGALKASIVDMDEMQDWTDEEVLMALRLRVSMLQKETPVRRHIAEMVDRLLTRRLYAESASLPLDDAPSIPRGSLLAVEEALATVLKVKPGSILLTTATRPSMLSTNILVRMQDGDVRNASTLSPADGFAMNSAKTALQKAAGRVYLFSANQKLALAPSAFREFLTEALMVASDPATSAAGH